MKLALAALLGLLASPCAALRPGAVARPTWRPMSLPSQPRAAVPRLATDEQLTPEQIVAAAEAASEPSGEAVAWPESKAPPPGGAPIAAPEDREDGFDPRLILYVSLPALVLIGQLFFTFSRDALGDAALSPAVMDLYVPY